MMNSPARPELSVVIPMLNESSNVDSLHARLVATLAPLGIPYELVCVDDGSQDDTFDRLAALRERDPSVRAIRLSRNFGKECAVTAGLDACHGRLVALMDADLQHPPETLATMIERMRGGYDVVYAVRRSRRGQGLARRFASFVFFALMRRASEIPVIEGAGDFCLMNEAVVRAVRELRESQRYMKGLFAWAGFRTTCIEFDQTEREGDVSRWTTWKLVQLGTEGITSFSIVPLRMATYLGLLVSTVAIVSAAYYFVRTVLYGDPAQGFPSLFVGMLFFGAVQLVSLGIIGEYVGRTYIESKRRPLYFVRESLGGRPPTELP